MHRLTGLVSLCCVLLLGVGACGSELEPRGPSGGVLVHDLADYAPVATVRPRDARPTIGDDGVVRQPLPSGVAFHLPIGPGESLYALGSLEGSSAGRMVVEVVDETGDREVLQEHDFATSRTVEIDADLASRAGRMTAIWLRAVGDEPAGAIAWRRLEIRGAEAAPPMFA